MTRATERLSIAVVGGGASGIAAALALDRVHSVTLFERDSRLGGHTNTVTLTSGEDAGLGVDTGFIVLNDRTYPTLHRMLSRLGVKTRWSDMSFSYSCVESDIEYAGTSLNGLFAQRMNLFRPAFWRMLSELRRFSRSVMKELNNGGLVGMSLGEYLERERFGDEFCAWYLFPMGAAIWSAPLDEITNFPLETFVRFFANHGLLALSERPRWQTVVGGSSSYVTRFQEVFSGSIKLSADIAGISRSEDEVRIRLRSGEVSRFDRLVIATHADQALSLLEAPTAEERELLGVWKYQTNDTYLHTDQSFLPKREAAGASWNFRRERGEPGQEPVSVTYDMNRLQGLHSDTCYCVTLNPRSKISAEQLIAQFRYEHPVYNLTAVRKQSRLPGLNGKQSSYFCGSYFGYGFHEDAVASGVAVARLLGGEL